MWQCEWATACKWLLIKMAQLIMIITAQEDGEREKAEERKIDVLHLLWEDFKLEGPKKILAANYSRYFFSVSRADQSRQGKVHCDTFWYNSSIDYQSLLLLIFIRLRSNLHKCIWPCTHSHVEMFRLGFSCCKFGLCFKKIFGSKYFSICFSVSIRFILRI